RPSVITGGDLVALQREGYWGNAWVGGSDLLVVEADESDGSLVRYQPAIGVVLNLQKDHRPMEEVAAMFATFRAATRERFVCGGDARTPPSGGGGGLGSGPGPATRASPAELTRDACRFEVRGVGFQLPVPGRHNVENALAAIATCDAVGVPLEDMVRPLASFLG